MQEFDQSHHYFSVTFTQTPDYASVMTVCMLNNEYT